MWDLLSVGLRGRHQEPSEVPAGLSPVLPWHSGEGTGALRYQVSGKNIHPPCSKSTSLLRCGPYKAHVYRQGSPLSDLTNPDPWCRDTTVTHHSPPLLYNLDTDPGERWDLAATEPDIVNLLLERLREEAGKVSWRTSEMEKGNSVLAAPCCNKVVQCSQSVTAASHLQVPCSPWPACCDCHF